MDEEGLAIIAAISQNGVIGNEGRIPWKIPCDLERFKKLTLGQIVIMGRKTYESLPRKVRPLPSRTNIVITRDQDFQAPGCLLANTWEEALSKRPKGLKGFIIGGAEIYRLALNDPRVTEFYRTVICKNVAGDVFFPCFKEEDWHLIEKTDLAEIAVSLEIWERK